MGTESELTWDIRGPDADGAVWIDIDQGGERQSFNLGAFDAVAGRLAEWMAQSDFGEVLPVYGQDAARPE